MSRPLPTKDEFEAELNAPFAASSEDGQEFSLELVEVTGHISNETQENFSVVFRGPVDLPPRQGIYGLANDGFGQLDVFLVPIKQESDGMYFEAVFNYLRTV